MYQRYVEKIKTEKINECKICLKKFKFNTAIYAHAKICKGKPKIEKELDMLQKEIHELKNTIRIQNLQRINDKRLNTNVSIFGQESIKHITTETLDTCWKRRDKGHMELINYIYKSSKNANIKQAEIDNDKQLLTFNGCTYIYTTKQEVYSTIYKTTKEIMIKHNKEHNKRLVNKFQTSESLCLEIKKYLEEKDGQTRDKIIKYIEERVAPRTTQ
jgi:hypothetical protein